MAHWDQDAFIKGAISGWTTSLDTTTGLTNVADSATGVASTEAQANGNDNTVQGQSGVRYGTVDNSRWTQLNTLLSHTAYSYVTNGGDMDTALKDGSQAVQNHNNLAWRASQAKELDDAGYDPHGIKSWILSGDNKDLVTGIGQVVYTDPVTGKKTRMDAKDAANITATQAAQAEQTRHNLASEQNAAANTGVAQQNANTSSRHEDNDVASKTNERLRKQQVIDSTATALTSAGVPLKPGLQVDKQGNKMWVTYDGEKGWNADKPTKEQLEGTGTTGGNVGAIDTIHSQMSAVRSLINAPGFNGAYGVINNKVGTVRQDTANAEALRDKIASGAFLEERQKLKGQGAISDTESKKAEQAATVITNPNIDPKLAKQAAEQYLIILQNGENRVRRAAGEQNVPADQPVPDLDLGGTNVPNSSTTQSALPEHVTGPDGKTYKAVYVNGQLDVSATQKNPL